MKRGSGEGGERIDRKTIEKNRRTHMKNLCSKLSSLIPQDHYATSKGAPTQVDYLGEAESYIKTLRERIDKLKQRKELASTTIKATIKDNLGAAETTATATAMKSIAALLPVVEVRNTQDTNLEVVVIVGSTGLDEKRFIFREVIAVLEEEGAEVVNASFSIVGDKIYHTFHSQDADIVWRIIVNGFGAAICSFPFDMNMVARDCEELAVNKKKKKAKLLMI